MDALIGRPPKYDLAYVKLTERWARQGRTRAQIAMLLGVDRTTMWRWESAYPEFRSALKRASAKADANVEAALYDRAVGATVHKQQVVVLKSGYQDTYREEVQVVDLVEQLPPDTVACIYWTKNRDPERWRDKIEHGVTGDVSYTFDDPTQRPADYNRKSPAQTAH